MARDLLNKQSNEQNEIMEEAMFVRQMNPDDIQQQTRELGEKLLDLSIDPAERDDILAKIDKNLNRLNVMRSLEMRLN